MANATGAANRVRIGGSGFTVFTFNGAPIAFCQQVQHTSPRPVGQGAVAVQPMDEPYPIEIITPIAAGMGQLVLNMFELFGTGGNASKVWDRLGQVHGAAAETDPTGTITDFSAKPVDNTPQIPFSGLVDIVDIFLRQASLDPTALSVMKIVRPLTTGGIAPVYTEEYHGCAIIDVVDGEQIDVGTMEIIKQVTVAYRFITRNTKMSAAFELRNASLTRGETASFTFPNTAAVK